MKRAYSRRMLLKAGAATGIVLPFLRKLEAVAQPVNVPKRLLVFATPNGTVMDKFWPSSTGVASPILAPLRDNGLASKVTVLRGIDIKTAAIPEVPIDHLPDNLNMLIGRQPLGTTYNDINPSGISVDQYIADAIKAKTATPTRFHSLQLAVTEWLRTHTITARGPKQVLEPELNPYNAYKNLFGNAVGTDPVEMARLRANQKSVLDLVKEELKSVRCELDAADRDGFDEHLNAIAELERDLDFAGQAPTCTKPTQGALLKYNDPEKHFEMGKLHMDLAVAAFACDLTRVITIQFGRGGSTLAHRWLGIEYGHHGIGHGSEGAEHTTAEQRQKWLVDIETWYCKQFTYLCKALDGIKQGNGTLLDSTVVLWAHEQQNGGNHSRRDMPYVLAGSCGGYFKTGQNLQLNGVPHNRLLLSLAEAMGVPTKTFGDPAFCEGGPIEALRA
ncbi:MAG: DUF1552 domain-containing protein [Myxococcaceae bacterium]